MKKLVVLIGFLGLVGSAVGMESKIDLVTAAGGNYLGDVNKFIDEGVKYNTVTGAKPVPAANQSPNVTFLVKDEII